jgi:hypothetical protein
MKKAFFLACLFAGSAASADVLEVNIYRSMPGMAPMTAQLGQEAKAIHEKLGATPTVKFDLMGRMHFAIGFENWAAWSNHGKKLSESKEWATFWAKATKAASAELEENYLLNVASPGGLGDVLQVYIWEATGSVSALVQSAMEAEKIHEKAGVDVSVNVDQLNRMHYVMSFANWDAWAKFQDGTPSEEWTNWWAESQKDPAGRLVKVHTLGSN